MTEQPVETMTEQEFLGNASHIRALPETFQPAVMTTNRQAYLPNGHRLRPPFQSLLLKDIEDARHEQILAEFNAAAEGARSLLEVAAAKLRAKPQPVAEPVAAEPDLWLDAEETATRAIREIQDGNINAGIAYLQASLAFALNHRHSLTEEVTR